MNQIKRPSFLRIDALKELGNIGSSHAITGLADLLKKRIDVSITNVDIIPLQIIYTLFNGPESMVSVVYLEGYSDDFRGMMFLIERDRKHHVRMLFEHPFDIYRSQDHAFGPPVFERYAGSRNGFDFNRSES